MSPGYFLMFIIVALIIYAGLHYYLYTRLAGGLALTGHAVLYLKIFLIVAALSFFLGEVFSRTLHWSLLLWCGVIWLGIVAISFSVFLVKDLVGLFLPGQVKALTLGALGLTVLISGFSLYNGTRAPRVKELIIPIKKLPLSLAGFTIVQLSDLHLDDLKSTPWLADMVERTNALNPDLIVITGDLVDEDIGRMNGFSAVLKQLKAKHGVYAVTGNHEYYAGIETFLKAAQELNITVLRNRHTTIAGALELVGIDDRQGRNFGQPGEDLAGAFKDCDLTKPVILLAHRPEVFNESPRLGVDLQLSGHTHAGQIPPMDFLVWLYYRYPFGFYQNGDASLYTTFGTGTWGPPMRLFSRSEIVKIVLQPGPPF